MTLAVGSQVLAGDDVFDVMSELGVFLVEPTVFTTVARPFSNEVKK